MINAGMSTHKIKGEDNYHCREVRAERDKLKAENQQLAAQVERLREALETITSEAERCDSWEFFPSDPIEQARAALDEAPAQALAEVEAAAIERMCNQWQSEANDLPAQHEQSSKGCSTYNWQTHYSRIGLAYASRLRTTNKSGGGDEH